MERLLTVKDLAAITGLAIQTLYNRHSNGGSLPACMNLGGRLRFRQRDVDSWLNAQYEANRPNPGPAVEPAYPRRAGRPTKAEQVARRGRTNC